MLYMGSILTCAVRLPTIMHVGIEPPNLGVIQFQRNIAIGDTILDC